MTAPQRRAHPSLMSRIKYDPSLTAHSVAGATIALQTLLSNQIPHSVLDVGCGTGEWLAAAKNLGAQEVVGVDGLDLPQDQLSVPKSNVIVRNLERPIDLGKRFDLIICLEVAEHLPEASARTLVRSITGHGDTVLFSAACPNQYGQHHINCQWPDYWQELFNEQDFRCDDTARWKIWADDRVEPWYRQNMFWVRRDGSAGEEPRIVRAVHPKMLPLIAGTLETGIRYHAKMTVAALQKRISQLPRAMLANWR